MKIVRTKDVLQFIAYATLHSAVGPQLPSLPLR
jgi:hypothetical protein